MKANAVALIIFISCFFAGVSTKADIFTESGQRDIQEALLVRMNQLESDFRQESASLRGKIAEISTLKAEITNLKAEMDHLKNRFQVSIESSSSVINGRDDEADVRMQKVSPSFRNAMPRSCAEARAADPTMQTGMRYIDPDGQGVGDAPIYVYCDSKTGLTSISHDSEATTNVTNCFDAGCYSRPITYNATLRQLIALADISAECHQTFRYDCLAAPFEFNAVTYSFWNDRYGTNRTFWAGKLNKNHTCQCGIHQNCIEGHLTCNCDSLSPKQQMDNGIITEKDVLPVTRLNFGHTQLDGSSGRYTLGRFECSGQATFGQPTGCSDLFKIGHTLNGFYSVRGSDNKIYEVLCDFTKTSSQPGFETRIGQVDVKSSPVFFYVQKNSIYDKVNTTIPFEVEQLNVGSAMNLSSGVFTAPRNGVYFFSFSAIDGDASLNNGIYIQLNGVNIGFAHGESLKNAGDSPTASLQSTLKLKAGDRISLFLYYGSIHDDDGYHFTHFTGFLLEEDF